MKRLSKESEASLLKAAQRISALVDSEEISPTAAVVKVARELRLERGFVPLVVQAYNTGRTTFQRESGDSLLAKLADFPLARMEDVLGELYPATAETPGVLAEKTAVSAEYSRPPQPLLSAEKTMAKVAFTVPKPEPYDRDMTMTYRREAGQKQAAHKAAEELRRELTVHRDNFLVALDTLGEHFKRARYSPEKLQEIRHGALLTFGKAAQHAISYVETRNGLSIKQAAPRQLIEVQRDRAPYNLIEAVIKTGQALLEKNQERQLPQAPSQPQTPSVLAGGSVKQSAGFFSGALGGGVGSALYQSVAPKPTTQLVTDMQQQLGDPDHENALRAIRAKAELSDFLANDEVISGYDPQQVMQAYNDIARLIPRGSMQPAIMRPLLRKHLSQSGLEPFEAAQMADIEKTLASTDPQPAEEK